MLNLLPMAPSCILLAMASSRADCVTEASMYHTIAVSETQGQKETAK